MLLVKKVLSKAFCFLWSTMVQYSSNYRVIEYALGHVFTKVSAFTLHQGEFSLSHSGYKTRYKDKVNNIKDFVD